MKNLLLSFFALSLMTQTTSSAQCTGSDLCENADIMCSIQSLDGFMCQLEVTPNTSFPKPYMCFGAGAPHNVMWWSFLGTGGPLTLTFNVDGDNCEAGQGLQAGVWVGCDGNDVWDCNAACNTTTFDLAGITKAGEVYFIFVDGCNGDVCPFTIDVETNNINPPTLPQPLPALAVSGFACPGGSIEACMPGFPNDLVAHFRWSVDGEVIVADGETCEAIDLPPDLQPGSVVQLCVTATLGNPDDPMNICDQATSCISVAINDIEIRDGSPLMVCQDQFPFVWNGDTIFGPCIDPPCTTRVNLPNGCAVDSVRIIESRTTGDTMTIDTCICNGDAFVTPSGETSFGTIEDSIYRIPRGMQCDSFVRLTVERPNFRLNTWSLDRQDSTLCVDLDISSFCRSLDSTRIRYLWHLNRSILDTLPPDSCIKVIDAGTYSVSVLLDDGCFSGQKHAIYVNLDTTTSVSNTAIDLFEIVPNPTRDKIDIVTEEDIQSIILLNKSGHTIEQFSLDRTISLQKQPAGVYFIVIKTRDDIFVRRVLKL